MWDKICDFLEDIYEWVVDLFTSGRRAEPEPEPMTEEDWKAFDEIVDLMFRAIRTPIRNYIYMTGTYPDMDKMIDMVKEERMKLRWNHEWKEYRYNRKLNNDEYWKNVRIRLEPLTSAYIADYTKEIKKRNIMGPSVNAIVTAQLDKKGLDYSITLQKTRLKIEIKHPDHRITTHLVPFQKFMQNPDIDLYL